MKPLARDPPRRRDRFFLLRAQRCQPRRRTGGLDLPDDAAHFLVSRLQQGFLVERGDAGEQFVEQDAERIHVAARVDVEVAETGLLRAHVGGGSDKLLEPGVKRVLGEPALGGLRDPEIDHLHGRLVAVQRHQHVGRFDVPVDEPFLVGVVDGRADVHEEPEPLVAPEQVLVAKPGDRDAGHQLHREVGPAGRGGSGIQHPRDIRVLHPRQRLALRREAREHLFGVHAGLDDLHGDPAADRRLLLGHPDHAKPAFPDFLKQLVGADPLARLPRRRGDARSPSCQFGEKRVRPLGIRKPFLDLGAERGIIPALRVEKTLPLFGGQLQRAHKNVLGLPVHPFKKCAKTARKRTSPVIRPRPARGKARLSRPPNAAARFFRSCRGGRRSPRFPCRRKTSASRFAP